METQTPELSPEEGWIKINVDGSYGETTGQASIGIIRDFKGHVILSAWKYLFQFSSAEEAKLLACREGLLLAHHWCHGPLVLESDCSNCIVALADNEINHSIHANLVEYSKNIMRMLGNIRFVKIS
jgi:hypothetical protein